MTDGQESYLNLLQIQQIVTVNVNRVADMYIKQHLRRLFNPTQLCFLSEIYCSCLTVIETDALVHLTRLLP